ncbi:SDR family NAD(P)-dependent oxidoreductase [uncultured Pseudokineococcus sp.]|uniref:SDR family NAD(P)-dependent oxidoreductase n=1 Tax=uncultured Pseudokineococcus sp. TaxID=1642928 RepID=UPI0026231D52|nr:SDR family NAD(P)-dependent oxidoreductase [uncultured Pseudokineococcus sp.]
MSRTSVVVGAGQGIGRAVAVRMAADGGTVHLVGRTRPALEETAAMVGAGAVVHAADATDPAAVRAVAGAVERADVVVHTVGDSSMGAFVDLTPAEWHRVLDANLTSAFLVASAFLPHLRASENPSLVLLASKTALKGYPVVAYSAAKAGVVGMARALAVELAPEHIRVVPLCPGPTDTPMRWRSTPDMDEQVVIAPESVADLVHAVVGLPRGTVTDVLLLQSDLYD